MSIPILRADAKKEQTVNALIFLSKAGAKIAKKMLCAEIQMQTLDGLESILKDLKCVTENVHKIWPTSDISTVLTNVNFCRAPRMIHNCVERLNIRLSDIRCLSESSDYLEAVKDVYFTFCTILESTSQLL